MFDHHLEAPPPPSQFRRPWSPDHDIQPTSSSLAFKRLQEAHYGMGDDTGGVHPYETSPSRRARREASDASVEALDLADYSRTLRMRQAEDPYPPFPSQIRQQNNQAPSSFPSLIPGASSTDYLPASVPSLVSRGPTLSSNATHHTFTTTPRSSQRHLSLPVAPLAASHVGSLRAHLNRGPYIMDQPSASTDGIDISRFPKWSRSWYNEHPTAGQLGNAPPDPDADIYTPLPPSQFPAARTRKSMFDPGYVQNPTEPFSPYDVHSPPISSAGHASSREVLPWSNDPPEYGPTLDPMLKEERMRMLEKEFGPKAKAKGKDSGRGLLDEEGKPLVGTIDEKGNLVTVGPRRRVALKVLQVLLAAAACVPAIYAAIVIKATDPKNPPPPANKPPTFVLYGLSSVTLLTLLYMFVLRPCCFVRPKSRSKHPLGSAANMGMMVLPVGSGGKKPKRPKAGKKGKGPWGPQGAQDVQVNLIVDPAAFHPPEQSDSESEEEEEDVMPGGYGTHEDQRKDARRKKRDRRRRRRGVVEGLAMEAQWRVARAWAKKVTAVNVAGLVLWSGAFVFIMTGKRCPSGGFNGWCNAFNVSIAAACLLAVSFGVGVFFNVQDLHASKQSPRTRS